MDRAHARLVLWAGAASAATVALALACGSTTVRRLQTGESCNPAVPGPDQCIGNVCLSFDNKSGYCTATCIEAAGCLPGFTCHETPAGSVCARKLGCTRDTDCPSGHVCDTATRLCYIAVVRGLCSPCTSSKQCPQGGGCFTVPGTGERFCTTDCAGAPCPQGFACREVSLDGATVKQCVPASGTCNYGRSLCGPCQGDDECGGFVDLCVRNLVSGEQFCAVACSLGSLKPCTDGSGCLSSETCSARSDYVGGENRCFLKPELVRCAANFTCADLSGTGTGPFQCVPNGNTCVGYCDSADERVQTLQCGLGRMCDVSARRCLAATDGRECAPCRDNDDCRKVGHPDNQCLVNACAGCPYQGETFCAEPCPATGGDSECFNRFGPGFTCVAVGTQSFCVPRRGTCVTGLGRLGDSCAKDGAGDCVTGLCLDYGSTAICSGLCFRDADCGDTRYLCCGLSGKLYDCSPAARNPANDGPAAGTGVCAPIGGQFGDDCAPGRPPCQSGTCLDIGTARLCTDLCAAGTCPGSFVCRQAQPLSGGDAVQVCFPGGGGQVGSDCTFGPAACADRLCIKKESGAVCTRTCAGQADCPDSWRCDTAKTVDGRELTVCLPVGV